jgi:hypothetical protein
MYPQLIAQTQQDLYLKLSADVEEAVRILRAWQKAIGTQDEQL